jgi:DNA-binding LacI/PurR family transcriptional regulator
MERKYPILTPEIHSLISALRQSGHNPSEIARQLGVDVRTAKSWLTRVEDIDIASKQNELAPQTVSVVSAPAQRSVRKRATIGDVASLSGVSVSTVSNFLNKKAKMSASTSRRIQSAIDKLNFRPNVLMKAVRENRTQIIGVVLYGSLQIDENIGGSIMPPILSGIDCAAEELNHDILLYTPWSGSSRITTDRFLGGHIDGLVWVAPGFNEPVLSEVAAAGLPVMAMLTRHVPRDVGYVNADNHLGIRMVVDHLVESGRSKIAYIGPLLNSNFADRCDAFRTEVMRHKLDMPESYLMNALWLPRQGAPLDSYYGSLQSLLSSQNRPDALICADDNVAFDALNIVAALGLRCPEDIAVTGFNDVPNASVIPGGLTTVRQPFREIAATGVRLLKRMIDGERGDSCRLTMTPTLVRRGSTAG